MALRCVEMMDPGPSKSDVLCLGILAGLCLLIGVHQIRHCTLINPDGVLYISLAQQLPGDYLDVARRYPAGYPFLLWVAHAAAAWVVGHDVPMLWLYSAQAATLVCRILALIPMYFLGKLLVGSRNSFWALLILVALPYPAQYGSDVLREWPYLLLLSLGFWLLYWGLRERRWWVLGLVGVDAWLGYLIRPECAQLVLYGLLGLGMLGWAAPDARNVRADLGPRRADILADKARQGRGARGRVTAGVLLSAGFLLPVALHVYATGTSLVPHQLRPSTENAPPIISAVGPRAASDDPLQFKVREEERLELPIRASDPQEDPLSFSLARTPVGSRPVYEFRSSLTGSRLWTIAEAEKDVLVSGYAHRIWDYVGIGCYAYTRAEARAGLRGVHRFWSETQQRHLYTMDERRKEALLQRPNPTWTYEQIAFYAFAEDNHPPDTVAIRAEEGQNGRTGQNLSQPSPSAAVMWYAYAGREPPRGAAIEEGVFCWRPQIGQAGDYQLNIIVSDGELQSCQLVQITVVARDGQKPEAKAVGAQEGRNSLPVVSSSDRRALPPSDRPASLPLSGLRPAQARLYTLPAAADSLFDAVAEDLMVVFLVPWVMGLYCRLRYWAGHGERVLVLALISVNAALVIGRHLALGPGEDRRYGLALVTLTIFYVPIGLDILAWWLDLVHARWRPRGMVRILPHRFWFCLLLAGGLAVCVPKLLTPMRRDKAGYRSAAEWLRQNTKTDDVLAVPDVRISFYAQRRGLFYRQYPDSRHADYIVMLEDGAQGQVPDRWRRMYAVKADRRTQQTLVIYRTPRAPP